jgi:hypothetical protein
MFARTIDKWELQGSDKVPQSSVGSGLSYDPQVFEYPEVIVEPRVNYMSELLR